MFDNCETLAELNAARIKAVSSGEDVTMVNNAYNARRYLILNKRKPFTVVTFKPVPTVQPSVYKTLPIEGDTPELGVLIYGKSGFYV